MDTRMDEVVDSILLVAEAAMAPEEIT